jgi:hypothetical protein
LTVETAVLGSPGPWRGTLFTGFDGALRVRVFGVKWRNWKLHFKEQGSAFDQPQMYTMPRV